MRTGYTNWLQRWLKLYSYENCLSVFEVRVFCTLAGCRELLTQPPCICRWCARAVSSSILGRTPRKIVCFISVCASTGRSSRWRSTLTWPWSTPWSTLNGRPKLAWRVRTTPFPLLWINSSSWRSPLAGWTNWTWVKIPHNYQTDFLSNEWTDWPIDQQRNINQSTDWATTNVTKQLAARLSNWHNVLLITDLLSDWLTD